MRSRGEPQQDILASEEPPPLAVPALAADSCPSSSPSRTFDGTSVVLVYVTLLVLIPSNRVVGPLGSAGTPAMVVSTGMLLGWGFLRLGGVLRVRGVRTPIHLAVAGFAAATLASYVVAMNGLLWDAERSAADRGLIALASWCGAFLFVADTLPNRAALERVLRWLAALITVESGIAITQFLFRQDWVSRIPLPGLSVNMPFESAERSNLFRVNGTAIHSIEFGIVASVGLALALHFALFSTPRHTRWAWWTAVAVIVASVPLTVARSATIGTAIVLITLFTTWPRAWQLRSLMIAPLVIVALRVAFPGVLGTIRSMFTWVSHDSSATARLTDYEKIWDLLSPDPTFGRGVGTLLPELYFILDNQYLMALVTTGILGLGGTAGLLIAGISVAVVTRRRFADAPSRHLTQSLLAGLLALTVSWSLFDGLSFTQATGVFWLLLGAVACLNQLTSPAPPLAPRRPLDRRQRFRALALRALPPAAVTLVIVALISPLMGKSGAFVAADAYFVRPEYAERGYYPDPSQTNAAANLLTTWLGGLPGREAVIADGGFARFTVAQGSGSLARPTERLGSGAVIKVRIAGDTASQVTATQAAVQSALIEQLGKMQVEVGAPDDALLQLTPITTTNEPGWQGGSRKRALVGSGILAVLAAGIFVMARRTITVSRRKRALKS